MLRPVLTTLLLLLFFLSAAEKDLYEGLAVKQMKFLCSANSCHVMVTMMLDHAPVDHGRIHPAEIAADYGLASHRDDGNHRRCVGLVMAGINREARREF